MTTWRTEDIRECSSHPPRGIFLKQPAICILGQQVHPCYRSASADWLLPTRRLISSCAVATTAAPSHMRAIAGDDKEIVKFNLLQSKFDQQLRYEANR